MSDHRVAGLALTAALVTGLPATAALGAGLPASLPPAHGEVMFRDELDDDRNGWGTIRASDFGSATFEAGDYVWRFTGRAAHLLPAVIGEQYDRGELDMRDVTVRATATIVGGDGVIGVFCRENPDTDADWQWYEFVARDGFAAIRRADSEGNLDVLAETETDASLGDPITITATCMDVAGSAALTMAVDDEVVLEAIDDEPLVNGAPGLQAYTFPAHEELEVRWHDFEVTQPSGTPPGAPSESTVPPTIPAPTANSPASTPA